ncbi:riboflavin kinase/FMN adenylyltransferase [Anaerosolibacter carboniphilus]|uniref:Riboflavin biosynthesis protein n=1 Tax=Anaerosolibacter carboniphilus TaxID=1417629 RepID=A0A841KSH3_9FIRM|nr:bifunctional riboflavin kinase/FAD synthetase [Anaerosolibacter carboniphilus]MBB6216526.1 riboflavin kinase/FMN adenylyltransferase [Anaerosolibacter carboniphilus]
MEIITSLERIDLKSYKCGVALGSFDGIHIGHQTLLMNLVDVCRKNKLKSVVYTFTNHPRSLTSSNGAPSRILSEKNKFDVFREFDIDYVISVEFDDLHRNLAPGKFIEDILMNKLNMVYGIVGFDYRFGYKAQGDINLLLDYQRQFKYELKIVDAVKIEDEIISSTAIRKFISDGLINKANLFLGRKYSVLGKIVRGKGLGHQLGFPTANLSIDEGVVLPKPGVYYTKCIIDQKIYYSITSVGYNPTFGENPITVESHILDFNDNLYGKEMEIQFYHCCRGEMKFSGVDALVKQVQHDIKTAKIYFNI